MPASALEFGADTAFERYILDRATPLIPSPGGTSVIELDGDYSTSVAVGAQPARVSIGVTESFGGGGNALSTDDIRPLLFGAAWKVLDLLIELGLEQAGVSPDRGLHYTIRGKKHEALHWNRPPVEPFVAFPDLWLRVLKIYASTEDLRNALIHRRLVVVPTTKAISGVAVQGAPAPTSLNADEQTAFCQVAAGVAHAVIGGTLPTRRRDQLFRSVDQLASHHLQPLFGASPSQGVVPLVIVRATPDAASQITLAFDRILSRAWAAVRDVSHYDIEIHLPDGRILAGPMEDLPIGAATFPVERPLASLRWK